MNYNDERQMILDEMAQFPARFGLRGFPGEVFRFSAQASYVSDGVIQLYTQRLVNGRWLDFAKGTPAEMREQVRSYPADFLAAVADVLGEVSR